MVCEGLSQNKIECVYGNEGIYQPVWRCDSLMCLKSFWNNNGGIKYIRLWQHRNTCQQHQFFVAVMAFHGFVRRWQNWISPAVSFLFRLSPQQFYIYSSPRSSHSTYSRRHSQPLLSSLHLLPLSLRCSSVQGLSKPFPQRSMAERDPFKRREIEERALWLQPPRCITHSAVWP